MMLDLGFMLTGLTPHIILFLLFQLDRVVILGPLLEVVNGLLSQSLSHVAEELVPFTCGLLGLPLGALVPLHRPSLMLGQGSFTRPHLMKSFA